MNLCVENEHPKLGYFRTQSNLIIFLPNLYNFFLLPKAFQLAFINWTMSSGKWFGLTVSTMAKFSTPYFHSGLRDFSQASSFVMNEPLVQLS